MQNEVIFSSPITQFTKPFDGMDTAATTVVGIFNNHHACADIVLVCGPDFTGKVVEANNAAGGMQGSAGRPA